MRKGPDWSGSSSLGLTACFVDPFSTFLIPSTSLRKRLPFECRSRPAYPEPTLDDCGFGFGALLKRASHRPGEAGSVVKDAKQLRRTIYSIFSDIAHMRAPSDEDVAELNSRLTKVLPHMQISQQGGDFFWDWEDNSNDLDGVLWSMARCAANLLCSGELGRVSECNSETCTWLFLDRSKNVSRKWCDMGTCGNRAKSRRHYARTHGQAKAGT